MDSFQIKNKINEIRSYIASNWPGIEERRKLYEELSKLEEEYKKHKSKEDQKT